jgi:hypothetical protein
MNTRMLHALADCRVREIRRDAESRHLARRQRPRPLPTRTRPDRGGAGDSRGHRVRNRVGYALVAAGLRLVVTSVPQE